MKKKYSVKNTKKRKKMLISNTDFESNFQKSPAAELLKRSAAVNTPRLQAKDLFLCGGASFVDK